MLSEIEQFYREQDQRMDISDGDSDEDSLRNIHTSDTAPVQKGAAINVAVHPLDSLYATADLAKSEKHPTRPATSPVIFGDHIPAHPATTTASSLLRREKFENAADPDNVGELLQERRLEHPRKLRPQESVNVFSPGLRGIGLSSGDGEMNEGGVRTKRIVKPKDALSAAGPYLIHNKMDDQTSNRKTITTAVTTKSGAQSGTHNPLSIVNILQGVTDSKIGAEPERVRKMPKTVALVSSTTGEAADITDLTLDFSPQLTSTQVIAGLPRKARSRADVKSKASNHATYSPRRDKVIRTPVAPKSTGPHATPAEYSSNITTPANSNPTDAPIFPSSTISDKKSNFNLTSDNHSSKQESKPKKEVKRPKVQRKNKPGLVTPLEYARKLLETLQATGQISTKKYPKYLKGKRIFYIGGDMQYAGERTRNRMDFIIKHGGTLLPTYDASAVTHIVTDAPRKTTLRALGLRALSDIPDHVPTVKWEWVPSGLKRTPSALEKRGDSVPDAKSVAEVEVEMDDVWMHAAFLERFDAGAVLYGQTSKGKGKEKAKVLITTVDTVGDISRISEFTPKQPLDLSHIGTSSKSSILAPTPTPIFNAEDPLLEFYALAKAEAENAWPAYGEECSDDDMSEVEHVALRSEQPPVRVSKRGFTCDDKEAQNRHSPNQDVVDKLQELMELHKAKPSDDDRWRAFSYGKCLRGLRNYPKRITSYAEARSIRGVGDKTALKIMEILQTGDLRRIGYEKTEDVEATKIFQGIYGVGQSTAFKWYASGCRTLEDVKAGKGGIKLSLVQEIGVRFYEDINDRMPRAEADAIFQHIKPLALAIDPRLSIDIMGSFRRGKADCGDIDILITRPVDDGKNHIGVLRILLRELHGIGLLTEDLSLPTDWDDLECVYRGLCRLPDEGKRRRRIDILTVPWQSRGAALIYYTGDDIFNRAMRYKAGTMGYSLNQRGLYEGVIRDPRDRKKKLNAGMIVASETEEEIFRILGVPWQEPHERVRG